MCRHEYRTDLMILKANFRIGLEIGTIISCVIMMVHKSVFSNLGGGALIVCNILLNNRLIVDLLF
jgi:hypothetical protein